MKDNYWFEVTYIQNVAIVIIIHTIVIVMCLIVVYLGASPYTAAPSIAMPSGMYKTATPSRRSTFS